MVWQDLKAALIAIASIFQFTNIVKLEPVRYCMVYYNG